MVAFAWKRGSQVFQRKFNFFLKVAKLWTFLSFRRTSRRALDVFVSTSFHCSLRSLGSLKWHFTLTSRPDGVVQLFWCWVSVSIMVLVLLRLCCCVLSVWNVLYSSIGILLMMFLMSAGLMGVCSVRSCVCLSVCVWLRVCVGPRSGWCRLG